MKDTAARWTGALEGVEGELLYGWCVDTHQPDARVVLEICHNGEPIDTVIADVARADLSKVFRKLGSGRAPADPCHGFVADIGARREAWNLRARVANTSVYIDGEVKSESHPPPPPGATSFVYSDGGLRLHGWLRQAGGATIVRAFLDSREIAIAIPGDRHPSLRSSQAQAAGFVLDLPPSMANGAVHSVRVVDAQGIPLNGSPITVCCFLEGGKALLDGGHKALLAKLLESHERYVPRSLSSQYYREWTQAFEQPASAAGGRAKVGVIVRADGDDDALKRTRQAVHGQRRVRAQTFVLDASAPGSSDLTFLVEAACNAGCDFIACVRAGDLMPPHALACVLEAFKDPATQVAYTDSEFQGVPWFKPAWNLEYALASDYALELMLSRAKIAMRTAKASPAPKHCASLAWNILVEAHSSGPQSIRHVPRVLYAWGAPPTATETAQRTAAAQDAFKRLEPAATLEASAFLAPDGLFQPRRPSRPFSKRERNTSVSLIIPTRDRVELLQRCVESLRAHTRWPRLEIIIVDNDSTDPDTRKYLRALARQGVRILAHPGAFNFAAMNNHAVEAATGEIVGLVNNDIEALHDGWLDEIVGQLLRPHVGVVGAKLLWPNGMVQHGGVVLGMGNGASHFGNRLADGDWGDHGRNQLVQQVSAVTAACLLMRRQDFLGVGGMDAKSFPVNFNDVDLCLKIRAQGKAVVWTPHACLLHAESASRGKDEAPHLRARVARELVNFRERWGHVLLKDPAYHPSLNLDPHSHAFGGLALPPRDRSPRLASLPS